MRIAVFDTHGFERDALLAANEQAGHELVFYTPRLDRQTAVLARGSSAVCCFVNDRLDADALGILRDEGVRLVALRSAGFNHVDLAAADRLGLAVVRVPEYSPYAVAEHAFAMLLALVRKIPRAVSRVREGNFSLEGLVGFDLHGKTFGVVGTGKIGAAAARIAAGFGCRVLAHDAMPDERLAGEVGLRYVSLDELLAASDVVSLHVPLMPETRYLLNEQRLAQAKQGVVIVNTGRGALVDTGALLDALKRGHVGGAALDVYEREEGVFFQDLSDEVLQDDLLARLLTFPNVLVTSHQAFLTREALANIAATTLASVTAFERGEPLVNVVQAGKAQRGVRGT